MYTPTELDLIYGIWKNGRTCIQFDPPKIKARSPWATLLTWVCNDSKD